MLEELIQKASVAVAEKTAAQEMFSQVSPGPTAEKLEMGLIEAKKLGLDSHAQHYRDQLFELDRLRRIEAMSQLGWPKITAMEAAKLLFPNHNNLELIGTNQEKRYLSFVKHLPFEDYNPWHLEHTKVSRSDGAVPCKYYGPTNLSGGSTSASKVRIRRNLGRSKWSGDVVTEEIGTISAPDYLINFIPPEILARMNALVETKLVNTFLAAGYTDAFDFTPAPRVHRSIDPIIMAVVDDGFGIANPLRADTQMFFVGRYI